MQRDHVHIAFDDDHRWRAFSGVAGEVGARRRPGVKHPAFLKQRRVGRVQIFRLVVAQGTAAKGDDPTSAVADREHHPAAEIIIGIAAAFRLAQ